MKYCDFLQKVGVSEAHRGRQIVWVGPMVLGLLVAVGCPEEEPTYLALNESSDCVLVDVTEEPVEGDDDDSAGGDDDSAAADDDIVRTDLTCCGGDTVIGEGLVRPKAAQPGDTRYAAVIIDREAFEASGGDLDQIARASVSFDPHGVGAGEVELEQDGLEVTLWDGPLGCGELGGVPRTDELCFHLWAEETSEDEE
jgi:hypothetical protein